MVINETGKGEIDKLHMLISQLTIIATYYSKIIYIALFLFLISSFTLWMAIVDPNPIPNITLESPLYTCGQTTPPTLPVHDFFGEKPYPVGRLLWSADPQSSDFVPTDNEHVRKCMRRAAEIHRQVRTYARSVLKVGVSMYSAAEDIEARIRLLCGHSKDEFCTYKPDDNTWCAQAFPLGLSYNHCAAHYTPIKHDDHVIAEKDIIKVDFGVHCDGYIIDSAFTIHFDPTLDPLAQASLEATTEAIKLAGPDVLISELGNKIEEIICSYEVDYKNQNAPVKLQPVRNLSGHMVGKYKIHSGKSIPNCRGKGKEYGRMLEGETFACETFASTGRGMIADEYPVSHYMVSSKSMSLQPAFIKGPEMAKKLFTKLRTMFGTLAWSPRTLEAMGEKNFQLALDTLVKNGVVNAYPKLSDKSGCHTSQFEHTFMVGSWGTEVFSAGDDY
ncbi:Methionine aminopeptidase [Giardia duodenalis assemblage B]|uniref:Methionine aminopeptidase 2 n=1 Tax=Giardia duodenalis assemblage B TaxID=1394984 RepID=A0A132P0H6_GIAIN|nr:Methionine aminopeptidase [Giardia intestinalis assemblage B]